MRLLQHKACYAWMPYFDTLVLQTQEGHFIFQNASTPYCIDLEPKPSCGQKERNVHMFPVGAKQTKFRIPLKASERRPAETVIYNQTILSRFPLLSLREKITRNPETREKIDKTIEDVEENQTHMHWKSMGAL